MSYRQTSFMWMLIASCIVVIVLMMLPTLQCNNPFKPNEIEHLIEQNNQFDLQTDSLRNENFELQKTIDSLSKLRNEKATNHKPIIRVHLSDSAKFEQRKKNIHRFFRESI
jgi:hypothetical protein